jgi:hypothetical protein
LEEYEARKREGGGALGSSSPSSSASSSSNHSRSTSPRGSTFRRTLSDKRRALDSVTRGSRIVHRNDDVLQFMQNPEGPNLMQELQQRCAPRCGPIVLWIVRACAYARARARVCDCAGSAATTPPTFATTITITNLGTSR